MKPHFLANLETRRWCSTSTPCNTGRKEVKHDTDGTLSTLLPDRRFRFFTLFILFDSNKTLQFTSLNSFPVREANAQSG